jgi:hypothetical protein
MLDKLKENSRLVVAGLITAGVLALVIGNGGDKKNEANTDKAAENTQSQTAKEEPKSSESTTETSGSLGNTPVSGPVEVTKQDNRYASVAREDDNQTVIVRQMVSKYLEENDKTLGAAQRLFVETNIVASLPKDDLIFVGEEIKVPVATVSEWVEASSRLSESKINQWSKYL